MAGILNIAAYKFAQLNDLKLRRARLLAQCKSWGLKGTILLSPEGINLFVAGEIAGIQSLLAELRSWAGLETLEVKESESDTQPFNRMLVRLKKEIIAFGVEGINPAERTSPKLPARELKKWLDEGKPITLLDTRNDYEVKLGTFKNARVLPIDHFRQFPDAVRSLPPELKEQPIVMFCTGGIRCEKAGPFMEREGFRQIFQLEGGILKYFEECGAAHYEGECFVFDQRVGLDPSLNETDSTQCFHCLSPLTREEQEDPRYLAGKCCPYCHKSTAEQVAERVAARNTAIQKLIEPLPGSVPHDNYKPLSVPQSCDGATLGQFLETILPHVPMAEWKRLEDAGLLVDRERKPALLSRIVRAGERYAQKLPDNVEPWVNAGIEVLHEDEALIVLNKPAPLPMHPCGRFNRNTLQHIINLAYYPQKPKPAHRLDANTTGLALLTRTRHFASRLQPQFARGAVEKTYLALVSGATMDDQFTCEAPISVGPGEVGAREVDYSAGLPARTEFRVLGRHEDGSALLEAKPITGRTNQIRVHLWELGLPVVGDPLYLPGKRLGDTQTLSETSEPMRLHCWRMKITHPVSGQPCEFQTRLPDWALLPEVTSA